MSWYVAYSDKGPSGPCGQSVGCTRSHNDLYIFDDEAGAREFISNINEKMRKSRKMPKADGIWSDKMNNVIKQAYKRSTANTI